MGNSEIERRRADVDELFDAWEAAWTSQDRDAFEKLCTDEVHYEDPVTPRPLVGHREIAAHAQRLWTAFPDVRVEQLGPRLADTRMVAAPCRLIATHTGPLSNLPASGKPLLVPVVFYCELQGGRIHRARGFFDLYGAAVQLGLLPARGTIGEKALLMLRGFGLRAGH